jgi:hypothetical protein
MTTIYPASGYETLILHGAGDTYSLNVYERSRQFSAVGAVFVLGQRIVEQKPTHTYSRTVDPRLNHTCLLVGHTSDLSKELVPERRQSLDLHGWDCISLLLEEDEERRAEIVADLLKVNSFPCNLDWLPIQFRASALS